MSDLEELLRRCHRAELEPLARVLDIRADQLGLAQLAKGIAVTLRRRGAQDLANMVRRQGQGPPYETVLHDLARRRDVDASGTPEEVERRLMEGWIHEAWGRLPPEDRDRLWERLQLDAPAPADAAQALISVSERLVIGARFGVAAMAVTGLRIGAALFPPLLPVSGCLWVFYLGRVRDEVVLPAIVEVAALRQTVRHRVTVGVVGSPSCGKDAAIKALFGIDSGNVNPVAGSTSTVEITRLASSTALYVVNTPGMGDIIEAVTEEARQVLDLIDVFVYVINAQGGVQARELADYQDCLSRERPVLAVVNKIDTLKASDRERYLADARQKLGAPEDSFLAAAFDPLPQLSETPIGLEAVQAWIQDHLERLGKDPRELPWVGGARVEAPVELPDR